MNSMRKQGSVIILFFIFIFGIVGIYLGYNWYEEKYFINLYDGNMVRYLEIPPFAVRVSPKEDEVLGKCILDIKVSSEQAMTFLASKCESKGFAFKPKKEGFEILIKQNYVIKGNFSGNQLSLSWIPGLPENLKVRYSSQKNDKKK
ncbi:MAG: hypothetical protein HQM08_16775 [Candidatus Riflebacteria bacterium]|nr:hypothetical protein [Candidatus Riflebacteria bacterium]